MTPQLSADEQARARRFKNTTDRLRWAFIRISVRKILSGYVHQPPSKIRFLVGKYGKPYMPRVGTKPRLHFNLSHSGELALLAVTHRGPIGIDVEKRHELNDMEALVQRFFSQAEQRQFNTLPHARRTDGFYNGWTGKEAIIKALGVGLSAPLDAFDVPLEQIGSWCVPTLVKVMGSSNGCALIHIPLEPSYTGALAIRLNDAASNDFPNLTTFTFGEQPD